MKTLLLSLCVLISALGNAATIIVTNTNDSGAGSFRQAVADANMGDIIRFAPSLIASGSDTILCATPVVINKGLFVNGLYNATDTLFLSGGNTSAILQINVPHSSTYPHIDIDSLVFIDGNGATGTYGGAIQLNNSLYYTDAIFNFYIRNCVFRNNTAPFGGAIGSYRSEASTIYAQKLDIEIYDCTFKNNSATGAGSDGGAIYLYRKRTGSTSDQPRLDLTMERCNFLSNQSQDQGGAIYMYAENYQGSTYGAAFLTITGSTFNLNHTTNAGGAIYVQTADSYAGQISNSTVDVKTSTFTNNSVVTNGGVIYIQSTNHTYVYLRSSTFVGNTALNDGSVVYQKQAGTSVEINQEIHLSSNIFLSNNGNVNYDNSIYQSGNVNYFGTNNTNICDCSESDWLNYNANFEDDLFDKTIAEVDLLPLTINANKTYTMIPDLGSIAINASNTSTTYDAQNGPILGIRDIGAAESPYCTAINTTENASFCSGSIYDFYGQSLTDGGTYTHTIITPGACDTIVTLTLTETTPLVPTISITANPGNTIMTGTSVTITANITNGGSSPSYQWYADGNPTGPNAASIISSTLYDGVQVYCVVTSNASCVNPTSAQSNTITFTVHPNNDEPCNGIPLDVNSTCVTEYFANHIATGTTNVGQHTCVASASKDIWFTFIAPPSGNVYIFTYAGTLLDAVMSVYQGPNCSSLFEVGCIDDDGTNQMPQGQVLGAIPGSTYSIRVSSYGTTASGNFGICLVDPGNLDALDEHTKSDFSVYPNPASNDFSLNFNAQNDRKISIYSTEGTKVLEINSNDLIVNINSENLSSGCYYVEVEEDQIKQVKKLIINK